MRRQGIVVLGTAAVLAGWLARPHAQPAETVFVITPGPEVSGAVKRGAADVKKAQGLARKKQVAEAVALLEKVAAAHPAAAHDCNLALAYLRAGQLTRAQLMWDVSRQRGTAPPGWCDSSLAGQLATALRDGGYVPLTLVVSPAGAEVEVAGTHLRDLGLIWLPAGTHTVHVAAAGLEPESVTLAVALPAARATIALEPPRPIEPIDAAGPSEPTDAAVALPPADAPTGPGSGELPDLDDGLPPPPPRAASPTWPAFAGAAAGGVGLAFGVTLHVRALHTKDRANELVTGSDAFETERDRFGSQRTGAIAGYAVSAAAFGFATWYWLHRDHGGPAVDVGVGRSPRGDGAMLTVGGPLP